MTGPSLVSAAWLTQGPLTQLLAVLDHDGEEARAVGGAVRNTLLGLPVHEIDVATTTLPDEVVRRVTAAGFKAVPTGIEHGTITVVIDGAPFEVTTLRRDIETFGRHAKVAFGRDWKADAERRDFTINAFSVSRDGIVHDYVGGIADLKERKVRFIGEAKTRIAEDYLRILRFFRFHAAYGKGEVDRAGLDACIAAREGLDGLSRERIRMEMLKLAVAPLAAPVLQAMADTGIVQRLVAGVTNAAHLAALAAAEAALAMTPDAPRRLGALAVAVGEDAERVSDRLRLSNVERARLTAMSDRWWRISPDGGERAARAALYRLGAQAYVDQVLIGWARSGQAAGDTRWRDLAGLPQRWTPPQLPIKAAALMARGIAQGPALGSALAAAEAAWIAADFPSDKAILDRIADDAVLTPSGAEK